MTDLLTFEEIEQQLDAQTQLVKQVFALQAEELMNRRTAPGSWSILECLEHLNCYARYYHPETKNGITKVADSQPPTQPKMGWLGKKSIKMVHPQNTKKQKAYKKMKPSGSSLSIEVLEEFLTHQKTFQQLLQQAQQINYNKKKVRVEFFKMLKLSIYENLVFMLMHQQRHLQQANRLLEHLTVQSPNRSTHLSA